MIPPEIDKKAKEITENSYFNGETPVLILEADNGQKFKFNVLKNPFGFGLLLQFVGEWDGKKTQGDEF